jgi:DNA polymerase-3 subunit beta
MKLTIERSALLRSLSHAQSVVERKNTIPILSNVKLETQDDFVLLNATDMDLDISERVAATISAPGTITTSAHTLFDIVRKLPDGADVELTYHPENAQLDLKAGRSRFTLPCLPSDEFPSMSGGEYTHNFSLPAATLREVIDRTRFAISTEETRYFLGGLHFHTHGEGTDDAALRVVATDGHRLARVDLAIPEGAEDIPGIILPRKTVNELRKLVDETGMDVAIALSETKARFAFDDTVLISKLIEGNFPDYERVIPANNDKIMHVNCKEFAQAVDRVSAISTEKSRSVKLMMGQHVLTLSVTSAESGSAMEELNVDFPESTLEIGFNSKYLMDILAQISTKEAYIAMSDAASPTVIKEQADGNAIYVIMPMRV